MAAAEHPRGVLGPVFRASASGLNGGRAILSILSALRQVCAFSANTNDVISGRYITIDKMYGHMEADGTRDFIIAQSWMNIVECLIGQLAVLSSHHITSHHITHHHITSL